MWAPLDSYWPYILCWAAFGAWGLGMYLAPRFTLWGLLLGSAVCWLLAA